jgi:glutathione S-transferase
MSTTLQVYGFPFSQPTRSVLLLLKAAGVEFENHVVNIMAGQSFSSFVLSFRCR